MEAREGQREIGRYKEMKMRGNRKRERKRGVE